MGCSGLGSGGHLAEGGLSSRGGGAHGVDVQSTVQIRGWCCW